MMRNKGNSGAAFKPFDKGLLKRNAIEMTGDGEKFCQLMKGEPMETLVSPYCANEDYPVEMSFRRDGIRIKWSVIQQRIKILTDTYDRTFIETPPSLLMPLTEEMMVIDWLKELQAEIIWIFHPLQQQFIQNLFEIRLLKEYGLNYTVVFNNASQTFDQDLQFYIWEKTEWFADREAAGMIPFIPAFADNYEKLGRKLAENMPVLLETLLSDI
jgi:dethiobiotin synthetase